MDFVLSILKKIIIKEKIQAYIIGGYIYNKLLGNPTNDVEIMLEGTIKDTTSILIKSFDKDQVTVNEENNTIEIIHKGKALNLRFKEIKSSSIQYELKDRVFTIEGMAIDAINYDSITEANIIDPFNGHDDLRARIVKHNSSSVFTKNPINILKALALMAELDFSLSKDTEELVKENKDNISVAYGNEATEQLFNILSSKKSSYYIKYMERDLGILETIFPEINEMRCVGECKYHVVDVLTHSFLTLEIIEDIIYSSGYFEKHIREMYEKHSNKITALSRKRLEIIKLGAFFHDVGKPAAKKVDETGRTRFRGHEITGAEIVKNIAERLGLTIKERDMLYRLVSKHMIPLVLYKQNDVSGKALYKMFNELKEETLDVALIALADIIATRKLLDPSEDLGKYKIHIEYIVNNYLTRYKEVEDISKIITGSDIMMTFDLDEEVMIEDVIEEIRKAIYNGKIGANKEAALRYLQKIL